jgi:uncharacterized protein (TIGR03437 family)
MDPIPGNTVLTAAIAQCIVGFLLAAGILSGQTGIGSGPEIIEGDFRIVVEDRFDRRIAIMHYQLQTSAGSQELIFSESQTGQDIPSSSRVRVTGKHFRGKFMVGTTEILRRAESVSPNTFSGVRKIAVILVNYTDDQSEPVDQSTMNQALTIVNQYWQEASYGQYGATADIFGYYRLPLSIQENCADDAFGSITTAAIQAAQLAGVDLSTYQSIVVNGSEPQCQDFDDLATIGGNPGIVLDRSTPSAIQGQTTAEIITEVAGALGHELGHNLGFNHAHSIDCGPSVAYSPTATCTTIEYGDPFDVMGYGENFSPPSRKPTHYNAVHKEFLGWLTPAVISQTGNYSVAPFENPSASIPLALKITPEGATDTYYIEYRQPLGFDDSFSQTQNVVIPSTQVYTGALFHIPLLNDSASDLLNMHPGKPPACPGCAIPTPSLAVGETYIDYAQRFSVTTVSANATALTLLILVPPSNSPTLFVRSPADGSVVTGTIQVLVDALDRGGISKVELYRDSVLLDSQNASPYEFVWDTSKENNGAHTLTVTAYNNSAMTYSQSRNVTVDSTSHAPAPPSISILQPSNGVEVAQSSTITLTAKATAASGSLTTVEFFSDGLSLGLGALSSANVYLLQWISVPAGTHTVLAKVTDSNASVWYSSPITVIGQQGPNVYDEGVITASGSPVKPYVAPGSLVSIYGSGFSAAPVAAASIPLPASLGSVSVTFNGITAPLTFVNSTQINAQVPWDVLPGGDGIAVLVVAGVGGTSRPQMVLVNPVSPGIFTLQSGTGQAIAINSLDGALVAQAGSVPGLTTHPASVGDAIIILATGLGAVTPAIVDGHNASDGLRTTTNAPSVLIGGVPAQVLFSGLSPDYVGVNQINAIILPGTPTGNAVPLQIQVGGITTSNLVTLAVH